MNKLMMNSNDVVKFTNHPQSNEESIIKTNVWAPLSQPSLGIVVVIMNTNTAAGFDTI